jgi:hypothetical protein
MAIERKNTAAVTAILKLKRPDGAIYAKFADVVAAEKETTNANFYNRLRERMNAAGYSFGMEGATKYGGV